MTDVPKLYLVGPVGEWQDLTLRARDLLRRAGLVVARDVEQARPHLLELGVRGQLLESGREDALACILAALPEGEVAWLVRRLDERAGPAQRLARALLEQDVDLVSVPGASVLVSGLVAAGLPADRFTALGHLPASPQERAELWSPIVHDRMTTICEVGPGDLGEVLSEIQSFLGDRRIAICGRSNLWRGQVSEADPLEWDGTVTLTVAGANLELDWTQERVLDEIRFSLDAGTSSRDTAREVARRTGWPRRQVYELVMLVSRDDT